MRESFRTKDYYDECIGEFEETIERFSESYKEAGPKQELQKVTLLNRKQWRIFALYSRGDSLDSIKKAYLEMVDTWEDFSDKDAYLNNLFMLSLAVLFDIEKEKKEKIARVMKENGVKQDALYDFLINSMLSKPIDLNEKLIFPKIYGRLIKVISEEDKIKNLKDYIEKDWYKKSNGCYQACETGVGNYYGCWSFEAAAVAKIIGLDDTELKEQKYYPYELAHYTDDVRQ